MTLDDLLGRLQGVRPGRDGEYMALCPAHADDNASLSVTEGEGKLLLHCFAGCETEDIVKALGLEMRDLFADAPKAYGAKYDGPPPWEKSIVAVFDYTDESGKLLYQAVRHPEKPNGKKDFSLRRPGGAHSWTWSLGNVRRVLYCLPEVLEAVQSGATVYIPEGEKDCDNLRALGLTATTNSVGASSNWLPGYTESLTGANVVVLPDNDEPGRKHAEQVANAIHGTAATVKVLELPGLPEKGDVSDWLESGGTVDELLRLVEDAPEWTPTAASLTVSEPAAIPGSAPDGFTLTDLGNAERLIAAHGANLRFDVDAGQWLVWDGSRWAQDATGEVHRLAREVVRGLYAILPDCPTAEANAALYKHVRGSEAAGRLDAMVRLAERCPGVPVQAKDLDADPWLFNCANGTLDLRTGELREHLQSDLLTKLSPVKYDADATCPRWDRFLSEVFDGPEVIGFVHRMAGYILTGDTREQCFFLLTGKGSNGKSVLVNTLAHIAGDYAKGTPVTTFLDRRGENTSDLAGLVGARLVTASEGEGMTSFNESLLKQVSGGDPVTARHLYQPYFTFTPAFKVVFATNEVPRIRSQNYAMRRRVKMLPFRRRFYYPHEQQHPVRDERLGEKLKAEAAGILAWMVRGCIEWQKHGLGMPDVLQHEVESLFESHDVLLDFIEDKCELHPRLEVESGELWRAYLAWCEDTKTKQAFKYSSEFSRNLCRRDNIETRRAPGGKRVRLLSGIGLKDASGLPPDEGLGTGRDGKTPFCETLPREAHIEKVRENTVYPSLPVPSERENIEPDIPAYHMAARPGKCIHCDGRTEHTLDGEYFCYSCYKKFYTDKVEVTA